ncbi:hypothetical protein BH10ACI4_BH10ACI4_34870 [soil metagenome]
MPKSFFRICLFTLLALRSLAAVAQMPNYSPIPAGEKIDAEAALDRALKTSSLTFQGKPFHAVMEIGTAGTLYSGRVEVWWAGETKYKLIVTSPQFSQEKVVNGDLVSEKDTGDYYPRWLENFVLAILDPVPMAKNFRGHGGAVMLGEQITGSCLRRDDRPGGITDQLTWGMVCFSGSEPRLESVLTTNMSIQFRDWKKFEKKHVARTYETDVLDYKPVIGRMTALEELKSLDEATFAIAVATPADQRIATSFVSTLKEESLVEKAPVIEWPAVREGKTEGYMIVYARTDRTGQVRETAKHNSDQPGLEQFGMEQALRYKFNPLIVDGAAQQMEMPLVLHFISKIGDPLPNIYGEELLKQISGCPARLFVVDSSFARIAPTSVSVNEVGKLTGEGPLPAGVVAKSPAVLVSPANGMFADCHFAPLLVHGIATYYHGQLLVEHR